MSRQDTKSKKVSDIKSIPAKRLYRGVLEYARRLENGRQHRRNLMSVFQSEQTGLRHKLRDACERLMFSHPLEYGRKAEELLWRKVYYEVIQLVKSNKKFVKPGSRLEILYKEYLSAAVGYYHHLLMKLQSKHQPNLNVDWPYVNSPLSENSRRKRQILFNAAEGIDGDGKKRSNAKGTYNEESTTYTTIDQWALGTSYKIFLCLGDLGRYLVELGGSRSFPERFYQLALLVQPNVGLPFNQIGTLAGQHTWWGLTAAYCYYRCLESEKKFDGAEGNLQKLLDRNKKSFYQIPTDALENMISAEEYKKEHTRIFIISFLYLCDLLRPKTYATDVEITGLCKKLIDALPVCLTHLSLWRNGNSDIINNPSICNQKLSVKKSFKKTSGGFLPHYQHFGNDFTYLQPHIVLKMCSLCVINIFNLQLSRSNRSSAAICFTLAFFSHLLGNAITRLNPQEDSLNEKTSEAAEQTSDNATHDENGDGDASRTKSAQPSQGKKKKNRMMRRRRHRGNGDSDLSEGEFESGSDLSESEEDFHESDSSSVTSSNSELSQEEMDETILENTKQSSNKKEGKSENAGKDESNIKDDSLIDKRTGLELANSLANGQSTLASLKDMSQRMFQPTVKRRILLAPSFFNNVPKPKENVNQTNEKPREERKDTQEKLEVATHTNSEAGDGVGTKQVDTLQKSAVIEVTQSSVKSDNDDPAKESMIKVDQQTFHRMSDFSQYFGSLKLLCDWLDANEKVINACAQNSKALWSRLAKLTSLMPDVETMKQMETVSCDKLLLKQLEILSLSVESPEKWKQVARLPEDYILNERTSSVRYHSEKDKKMKSLICDLTETQQNVIRVCRIRSFCHRLVRVDASEMTYDKVSGKFDGPEEPQLDNADQLDIQAMEEMRKTRLMKDMAELRLRNEVNALESQLGSPRTRDVSLCLYLVPDALALCYDLPHIRKLLVSEKYFIVIPGAVIDGLDGLKKDLQGARDAIRFLETEFKKGNRFMKAQKEGEVSKGSLQGERPKLRRNDIRAWRFYRIIECCQFIMEEKSEENKSDSAGLVAILTHSTDKSTLSQNQINAISAAESIGVQVYSTAHFSKLWKKTPNDRKK